MYEGVEVEVEGELVQERAAVERSVVQLLERLGQNAVPVPLDGDGLLELLAVAFHLRLLEHYDLQPFLVLIALFVKLAHALRVHRLYEPTYLRVQFLHQRADMEGILADAAQRVELLLGFY